VFAVLEGYEGMVDGGARIRPLGWNDVGGILHKGGTVIGTARSERFRRREGRLRAAENLLVQGLDRLVVIGGDGSLTGAETFRREWPDLVAELAAAGRITQEVASRHSQLGLVGLVGSIDNDLIGTDVTIGADTALHRIVDAIDCISSTAASHQRTFVVEVMGRNCGYLALMAGIATGADWVLVPENPPDVPDWESSMCSRLKAARESGRRDSIVIVAEGARDRQGNPIAADHVKKVLEQRLQQDVRVTILGHVQRGGSPSAFDRILATQLGYAAAEEVLSMPPGSEPHIIGMLKNRITRVSLVQAVQDNRELADAVGRGDFDRALDLRGRSFSNSFKTMRTLVRAAPHSVEEGHKALRIAVLHPGGLAPGMNPAVRAAVRLALDKGHVVLGVRNGFRGFIDGEMRELDWMSVDGWAGSGGAELGTSRKLPADRDLYAIARQVESHGINAILAIGGIAAYEGCHRLRVEREKFPAFDIPIVCLPASIDNNLPGSELSIGSDTALNSIVEAVDKIKQSAVASQRCFVVEVMGRTCGYLALMGGLATGAERVYLNEEGVRLADLQVDLDHLTEGFRHGKRVGLVIRNEEANPFYTTAFMCALFEQEGGDLFDVRQSILGHLQQGGDPSPFDRTLATRLAERCVNFLIHESATGKPAGAFIGYGGGKVTFTPLEDLPRLVDPEKQRPRRQWWEELLPVARVLAQPGPAPLPLR
jgi:6-phosphofructokinase 1